VVRDEAAAAAADVALSVAVRFAIIGIPRPGEILHMMDIIWLPAHVPIFPRASGAAKGKTWSDYCTQNHANTPPVPAHLTQRIRFAVVLLCEANKPQPTCTIEVGKREHVLEQLPCVDQ
jgi:hypothetical protein